MPLFTYRALDVQTGRTIDDRGEFRDLKELFLFLRARNCILVRYRVRKETRRIFFAKVRRPELAEWCRNLSFLLVAGVPIVQALEDLRRSTGNALLRDALRGVLGLLQEGFSFAESLKKYPKVFPSVLCSLAEIGEETGHLDQTLEDAAAHLTRVDELISQTKRALWYPCFIVAAMVGALAVWFAYVLPKVFTMFREMHLSLPLPTRLLMKAVDVIQHYWPVLPVCLFVLISLWVFSRKSERLRLATERVLLRTPIVGRAWRLSTLAFFFEYMSLLLGSGLDMLRSLEVLRQSVPSRKVKTLVPVVAESIGQGATLTEACEAVGFFNLMELRMIKTGEESGKLVDQLKLLGSYYYKQLLTFVETLPKVLEPVLLSVAGVVFLGIVLALLGPVYELVGALGKMR
ncbi:type II secretion system F family protein [Desulfosoma caldarium]|uniref:General secretion pathway protein F/type IV pilus assembly protein PilC n=1 Tax=Desulfosoma caldarium TaxID=610254 RepID=A0A3N1UQ63_9BACT|nr:type II secretion system F family protein [Desulfosoma caldarium]ROQ90667.1 general secretion pathway protein F/type IV pilus assembly protein PilC [Desulfosoma caldarium]